MIVTTSRRLNDELRFLQDRAGFSVGAGQVFRRSQVLDNFGGRFPSRTKGICRIWGITVAPTTLTSSVQAIEVAVWPGIGATVVVSDLFLAVIFLVEIFRSSYRFSTKNFEHCCYKIGSRNVCVFETAQKNAFQLLKQWDFFSCVLWAILWLARRQLLCLQHSPLFSSMLIHCFSVISTRFPKNNP